MTIQARRAGKEKRVPVYVRAERAGKRAGRAAPSRSCGLIFVPGRLVKVGTLEPMGIYKAASRWSPLESLRLCTSVPAPLPRLKKGTVLGRRECNRRWFLELPISTGPDGLPMGRSGVAGFSKIPQAVTLRRLYSAKALGEARWQPSFAAWMQQDAGTDSLTCTSSTSRQTC